MYVGITVAGTFRTDDGGETWTTRTGTSRPTSFPTRTPRSDSACTSCSCIPPRPERLWQQNHCGTYRSDDSGDSWERLDGNGLPGSFGFALMLDPGDPDTAYVIPETSLEYHEAFSKTEETDEDGALSPDEVLDSDSVSEE